MELWQRYFTPSSVDEALTLLAQAPPPATPIAGGTDLLLDLEAGRHPPVVSLVDVSGIPEMQAIRLESNQLWIGAAAPLASILEHPLVQAGARCLHEACSLIGGPQVRNVATLGGNVAHALPAADGSIALLALEAEAWLASSQGRRWEPLEALFAGPGQPGFDRNRELLVGFRFLPAVGSQATAFRRVMRPQGVAIALLNMAAWIEAEPDGSLRGVRLSLGPAATRPFRARRTEALLQGKRLDRATLQQASAALAGEVQLRTSPHRATLAYRQHLLPALLKETLEAAYQRRAQP